MPTRSAPRGAVAVEAEAPVTTMAGLPEFTVFGHPDKAIAESRERMRAAPRSLYDYSFAWPGPTAQAQAAFRPRPRRAE